MKKRLKALEARSLRRAGSTEMPARRAGEGQDEKDAREFESDAQAIAAPKTPPTSAQKGVGRIYQQTFLDTYAKAAFAKLTIARPPVTAADCQRSRLALLR